MLNLAGPPYRPPRARMGGPLGPSCIIYIMAFICRSTGRPRRAAHTVQGAAVLGCLPHSLGHVATCPKQPLS
jgi:hypothetical protein